MFKESGNAIKVHEGFLPSERDKVHLLESVMLEMPNQVDTEKLTEHHFSDGIYLRSLFMPAGMVAVGRIHRHQTMNVLVYGEIQITTDEGIKTITGPTVFNTKPGTKKVAHAITDCLLYNIHATRLTNVNDIQSKFIVPEIKSLEQEK